MGARRYERKAKVKSGAKLLANHGLGLALMAVLCALAYGISLGSGFVADDAWQVQFAHRVLHGESDLLWANFARSYLSIPNLDFYRPLIGFSFVLDYIFGQASPFVYHLDNLLLALLSAYAFYFFAYRLAQRAGFGFARSIQVAFCSALMFAVSPLHVEAVVWVSGRADLIASIPYMVALAMLLPRDKNMPGYANICIAASGYICAMGAKEASVLLPAVACILPLVWSQRSKAEVISYQLRVMPILSLIGVLYLCLRYWALGSFVGGYAGDIELALRESNLVRWLDPITFFRLIFPLPVSVFKDGNFWVPLIGSNLAVILGLLMVKVLTQKIFAWRYAAFFLLFFAASALPLYRLWGLDALLHNSRIYYFLTMPMALILPFYAFMPKGEDRPLLARVNLRLTDNVDQFLGYINVMSMFVLAVLFAAVSFAISSNWHEAAKSLQVMIDNCKMRLDDGKAKVPLVLAGVPKSINGVQTVLCNSTLRIMLEPPFVKRELSKDLITFDSHLVGPQEPINASRYKYVIDTLSKPALMASFVQADGSISDTVYSRPTASQALSFAIKENDENNSKESGSRVFVPQQIVTQADAPPMNTRSVTFKDGAQGLALTDLTNGSGLVARNLALNPLDYDFLEFEMGGEASDKASAIYVTLNEAKRPQIVAALSPIKDAGFKKIRLRVSHYVDWYAKPMLDKITLGFSPRQRLVIKNIRLVSDLYLSPLMTVDGKLMRPGGEYPLDSADKQIILRASAAMVSGAKSMIVQKTFLNRSFDNFALDDDPKSLGGVIQEMFAVDQIEGNILIDAAHFSRPGFYELRAIALGRDGKVIGEPSDSVLILKRFGGKGAPYYRED